MNFVNDRFIIHIHSPELAVYKRRDLRKIFEWFERSAKQGDSDAQYALGVCYENGNGVDIDIAEARK